MRFAAARPPASTPGRRRPVRATALAVRGDQVLVMQRRKQGRDYAKLIGGSVKRGEPDAVACLRELAEETGLAGTITADLGWPDDRHHLFAVTTDGGEPVLGGPERRKSNPWNRFRPRWVDLDTARALGLRPTWALRLVVELLDGRGARAS